MSNRAKLDKLISRKMPAADFRLTANPEWQGIIIHHTGIGKRPLGSADPGYIRNLHKNIADWLTKKDSNYVSAHFQISWYGEIWELVDPFTKIAFHAGTSSWFHAKERKQVSGCNNYTIGIELLGDGNMHDFSKEQYEALAKLIDTLMEIWPSIDPRSITGHENVAPGRKTDPGKFFDWRRLYSMLKWGL